MKNPKRLTRAQKIFLDSKHFNPENWLLVKETSEALIIFNKISKKVKEVGK